MSDPLGFINAELDALKEKGLYRNLRVLQGEQGAEVNYDGKKVLQLSSNNYLGLNTHPRLRKAMIDATEKYGAGSGAVRTIAGTMSLHEELERKLAEFKHVGGTLVLQSGFTANMGVIPQVVDEGDLIISDQLNHASIIDGVRLSKAARAVYAHADVNDLERVLKEKASQFRRILIITDGVFSMDGDIADIKKLVELKKKYDCILMIDEAHAFGIFGENLCGVCEKENISGEVDVITATLGKSFASVGAFCVADKTIVDYLVNKASSFIFSTAMAPVNVMWSNWLIENKYEILKSKRDKLTSLFNEVHGYLNDGGKSQIIPVILGDNKTAVKITDMLQEEGYFVLPIRPPTVPQNTSRVRLSLIADMSFAEVKNVLDVIKANI